MDEFFGTLFGSTAVSQQLAYLQAGLGSAIWETIYSTVLSTFFAYVIGLPLDLLTRFFMEAGVAFLQA